MACQDDVLKTYAFVVCVTHQGRKTQLHGSFRPAPRNALDVNEHNPTHPINNTPPPPPAQKKQARYASVAMVKTRGSRWASPDSGGPHTQRR